MSMETARERQEKEIKTIREKNIKIRLSEADCDRLSKLCGEHGLTVGELIENFIGDLVCGTYSNGSDERDLADQWFHRCGFGMFPEETLLNYLLNNWMIDVEEFLNLLDNIETGKEDMKKYESNPGEYDEEEIDYLRMDLEDWEREYHDTIDEFVKRHPEADIEKEIEALKKWFEESEHLKSE